jgi:hypothetical protein
MIKREKKKKEKRWEDEDSEAVCLGLKVNRIKIR